MDFMASETKINLMKAFAGESQARNRYTFGASAAKKEKLYVIEAVFTMTANQEKEHAEIFYNLLKNAAGDNINICGGYPVDINDSAEQLLRFAARNEYEEYNDVYKSFAETASDEGFTEIAASFRNIAEIEKVHGDRFKKFADLLNQGKLFVSDVKCKWMCLNCGFALEAEAVPEKCPVCQHDKGYFVRMELYPFEPICAD